MYEVRLNKEVQNITMSLIKIMLEKVEIAREKIERINEMKAVEKKT